MLWYFSFVEVKTEDLEVLTQGLKTIMNTSNNFSNMLSGLNPQLFWKVKKTLVAEMVANTMRHVCYMMGLIAN